MKPGMTQVLAALIAAAAAGGLATAAGVVLVMVIQSHPHGLPSLADIVAGGMMVFLMMLWLCVFTTGVFATGLLIVGIPAWVALYRLGFRSRWTATLAGGLLAATTMSALALTTDGPGFDPVWVGLLMLPPGMAAGWTLHRVVYGKTGPRSV